MDTKLKGSISRETIRSWLDNYQALISEDKNMDDIPHNGGRRPEDGIPDALLNRIILTQALTAMHWEAGILYSCCRARWIDRDGFTFTLRRLRLTKDQYYKRCDWAIDYLYYKINGIELKKQRLLLKLRHFHIS